MFKNILNYSQKIGTTTNTKYLVKVEDELFIVRISKGERNKIIDAFMMTENTDLYYWMFSETAETSDRNEKLLKNATKRIMDELTIWKEEAEEAYFTNDVMNLVSEYIL